MEISMNARFASRRCRLSKTAKVTLACIAGLLLVPAIASAAALFSGGLSPGRGFASTSAPFVDFVDLTSDHTTCPAAITGAAGYFFVSDTGVVTYYDPSRCTAGSGYNFWYTPSSVYTIHTHAAVFNPNGATNVSVSSSSYSGH
jgi:hypothetical protein